jgi:DNA-binding transcriptional MerR regulator
MSAMDDHDADEEAGTAAPPGPGLTLAALAERSGLPARTIRYYQSAGVLPKPARRGREAVYSDDHHERLRLIAELRDRGLTLGAIKNLFDQRASPARSVAQWLGVDDSLRAPWSDDQARVVADTELGLLTGERPPGTRRRLEDSGYLTRRTDGTWLVPSPALLDIGLRLQDAGIDLEVTAQALDLLRRRLVKAVDDLIELFVESAGSGFGGSGSSTEVSTALRELRPMAREASGIILAQEIERGLEQLLKGGPASTRKRSSKRSRHR